MTDAREPSDGLHHLEDELAEHAEEELLSLRHTFAERRLSVRTMDTPLRLATAGAIASVVGAALLLALRDVGSSQVTLLPTDGVRTTLGRPLFVAALVLLALGLGYIACGAALAHRVVAILTMLVITFAIGYDTGVIGFGSHAVLPHWAFWATRGLLVVVWLITLGAIGWRRGRHGDARVDRTLRIVVLVAFCTVFAGYLLVLLLASPTLGGLSLFPFSVELLMGGLTIVTVPILIVAAVDFAEWGQLSAERLLALVPGEPLENTALRLAVPAVGALGLLAWAWFTQRGRGWHEVMLLGKGVGLFAIFVGILVAAGVAVRVGRQAWPATLNFAALFAVVAVNVWLIAIGVGLAQGQIKATVAPEVSAAGEFTAAANVRSLRGPDGSTILVPAGWLRSTAQGGAVVFRDLHPRYGKLSLLVGPLGPGPTIEQIAAGAQQGPPLGAVSTDGRVQQLRLHATPPFTGYTVWVRTVPGSSARFLILGLQQGADPDGGHRLLAAMVGGLHAAGQPPAHVATEADATPAAVAQANTDRLEVVSDATGLTLSLIGLALLAGLGRRWSGRLRATILLFGAISVGSVLSFLGSFGRVLVGPTTRWPSLSVTGILAGIALMALVLLAAAAVRSRAGWARRLPGSLTGLLGGILVLRLLDELYTHALSASRVAVWAAIVVLVAVAWDVTMSGESLTNHGSRLAPRSSRVLLFYGYIILLASAVVFYSGQRLLGSGAQVTEVFFEPEAITQGGIYYLALPLLVLLFLLQTFVGPDDSPERLENCESALRRSEGPAQFSPAPDL